MLLAGLEAEHEASAVILEVAPAGSVSAVLRSRGGLYLGADVDPAADHRIVQVVADLCRFALRDRSVNLAVVFHVFEHIGDDAAAMRELARVLADDGLALIQVPWRRGAATAEDPGASTEERTRRFGQPEHVRFYGADFDDRLLAAGLCTVRIRPEDLLPDDLVEAMGLTDRTPIWMGSTAGGRVARMSPEDTVAMLRSRLEAGAIPRWREWLALPVEVGPGLPLLGWVVALGGTRVGRTLRGWMTP